VLVRDFGVGCRTKAALQVGGKWSTLLKFER
jgi:hypothetical protein